MAQRIGLLDPYGSGDAIPFWHSFASEVRAYLDFLKEYRTLSADPLSILDDLRRRLENESPHYRALGAKPLYWRGHLFFFLETDSTIITTPSESLRKGWRKGGSPPWPNTSGSGLA